MNPAPETVSVTFSPAATGPNTFTSSKRTPMISASAGSWPVALLADPPRRITSRHHSPSVRPSTLRRRFQLRVLFLADFETDGFRAQRRLHHVPAPSLAIPAETSSRA